MVDRNSKQIKSARAEDIKARTQLEYKRKVEDIKYELDAKLRELNGKMDISPDNTFSIIKADSFDAKKFVKEDYEQLITIRNLEIEYEILRKRYIILFGGEN